MLSLSLVELLLRQFCDAHTCSGKRIFFPKGGKVRFYVNILCCSAYVIIFTIIMPEGERDIPCNIWIKCWKVQISGFNLFSYISCMHYVDLLSLIFHIFISCAEKNKCFLSGYFNTEYDVASSFLPYSLFVSKVMLCLNFFETELLQHFFFL